MSHLLPSVRTKRSAVRLLFSASILLIVVATTSPIPGSEQDPIIRVEEDWELLIGQPDPDGEAPQVLNVISPISSLAGHYSILEINHATQPEYNAGGIQIQRWWGERATDARSMPSNNILSYENELVKYTIAMEVSSSAIRFEVLNGTSQTWGAFGGQGYLKTSVGTYLSNLEHYSPTVSVNNSRVGYAANRVASFKLVRVRYIKASGQITTDDTERVVHVYDSSQS